MKFKIFLILLFAGLLFIQVPFYAFLHGQEGPQEPTIILTEEEKILGAMHSLSSHTLLEYVKELCQEKYSGRLTGTAGYNAAAQWVVSLLQKWDIQPAGDNGSYYQDFPNPYTLVLESGDVALYIPYHKDTFIEKHYQYEKDFLPGSTSGSGEVKGEVVYVGYGITAPELGYDEYQGVNVKGKIVLMEREVPVSPEKDPELFKKWRPYSFHPYKVKNARDHGAVGILYNYLVSNPNCIYIQDLILSNVGKSVVDDIFLGTGVDYRKTIEKIRQIRKPRSFNTKKIISIRNVTAHHPEGMGRNVLGYIEGSDPELKKEVVMLSAHLDHLGLNHLLMPGANDNASGVAVQLGVAEAIHNSEIKPRRSIILAFFGAEEQGVKGSEYYLQHPFVPTEKIVGNFNLDGVGRGKDITVLAGKNYPALYHYVEAANQEYIHRKVTAVNFHNRARPRLDAAHFMWAGVPTLSFNTGGAEPLPYETYHNTRDNLEIITPEIMEDLAQLLFIAIMKMTK